MVQVVMLLICIQEVAGLNFGWGTDYPDWGFSYFSSALSGRWQDRMVS
jgi:hypothetical protein